jgi:putative sigma-54 modulation protein
MSLKIQTVHFDADSKLLEFIERRIEKVKQFHDRITHINVYLKLDNIVHNIKDKIVEIRVSIPKHELFVKQSSKSFEESFDAALNSMINQIKRRKERMAA